MIGEFTDEEFEYFKERCLYWLSFFYLNEYDLIVAMENNLDKKGAECRTNSIIRQAQIVLFKKYEVVDKNKIKEYLEKTAIHEVGHILTADYSHIAQEQSGEIETRVSEAFANRLANAMMRFHGIDCDI